MVLVLRLWTAAPSWASADSERTVVIARTNGQYRNDRVHNDVKNRVKPAYYRAGKYITGKGRRKYCYKNNRP